MCVNITIYAQIDLYLVYNMVIPTFSGDHTTGFVDSPADRADLMITLSFQQYCMPKPVIKIACYHLYEQIQFITFIINPAVFAECKAGFDSSINDYPP